LPARVRKDYTRGSGASSDGAFVAEFWDRQWRDETESAVRRAALRRSEEYRFLARCLAGRNGLQVLDCGCGTGDWTLLLREDGHQARGIDIAPEIIGKLRERFGDVFERADFRSTPFADASFDLVINWGGIEHFEEGPLPAVREAFRLLRPGGTFVATTPCHNLRLFLLDAFGGQGGGPGVPESDHRFYQYRFTRAELESYFRSCGFASVRSRTINAAQGMERAFQHELRALANVLPGRARTAFSLVLGPLLRRFLGHMVICSGRRT
jgi:SAM-dependent methyltransferase